MEDVTIRSSERRMIIVAVTAFMVMLIEVAFGLVSRSMALTAEGIHSGTHVIVLSISLCAYILARRRLRRHEGARDEAGEKKAEVILSRAAFISASLLLLFAIHIGYRSGKRLLSFLYGVLPSSLNESWSAAALAAASAGLAAALFSAFLLHGGDDLNRRAAYYHVLSDTLTSIGTIAGIFAFRFWGVFWLDAAVALLSAALIVCWAVRLMRKAAPSVKKG